MADEAGADVFISYKRRKRPEVEHIAAALRALKLSVWFDARLEAGVSFSDEIATEVRRARAVLVCWTNDCFPHGGDENGWVRAEAAIARSRGVYAPCFLEPTDLDPPFNNDHAESLIGWASKDGLGAQDHEGWLDLLAVIGKKVARPGLAAYSKAQARGDVEGLRRFARDYPTDPLADGVWNEIAEAEADAARARTDEARRAALEAAARQTGAQPPPAEPPKPAFSPRPAAAPTTAPAGKLYPERLALIAVAVGGLAATAFGVWLALSPAQREEAPAAQTVSAPTATSALTPDEDAWGRMSPRSRANLEAFVRQYPSSRYASEARALVDQQGRTALAQARAVGTAAALQAWLREWPQHPDAGGVRTESDGLAAQESLAAKRRTVSAQEILGSQATTPQTGSQARAAVRPMIPAQPKTDTASTCNPITATVYFAIDRSDLSADALAVLDGMLARARGCGRIARVQVNGHTDTSASSAYSQRLSERIAAVVREAFQSRGVNPAIITTTAFGETQLAKATPDGVREPLNRRADVTMWFR